MSARADRLPLHLSIFLSSPGDVSEFREAARSVLTEIAGRPLLKGRVTIEAVSCDDARAPSPLALTETPQLSVNRYTGRPADCDLTVVILGGRLGTPLPSHIRRADGTPFESGTVWEYEDARDNGKEVWLYCRTGQAQDDEVTAFLARFRDPDGSLVGGYHAFESVDDFADRFARHIESFVRHRLDGHEASQIDGHRLPFVNERRLAEGLVGRVEVFAAIDAFQASHPAGYFVLTADAGLGKTTFAASVAERRGAPAFFASRARGLTRAAQCLNHLSADLIARFGLPYAALPLRSGDDSTFLERVLREAADAAGEPIWIVVDGLDEAEVESGRNALGLPSALPPTVYCLLTQRPGDDLVTTDALTATGRYELTAGSAVQQADVIAFLEREAERPEMAQALRAAYPAHRVDGILADLARLSEGNFLYLTHVLRDLAAGESWVRPVEGRVFLPEGLKGYYGDLWARMEGITQTAGGADWRTLYRPVIGLLAVAREAVTVKWLADISGCDPEDVQNPVLSRWRTFLTQEVHAGQAHWRIHHRSFGEFLAGKLDLQSRHAAVARYFEAKARWATHNHYASRHLSAHLQLAGHLDGLSTLLRDPDWYVNQMTQDASALRYASDVQALRVLASGLNQDAARAEQAAPALAPEVEAALLSSTIAGFWSHQRLDAVEALLDLGIMSSVQALDIIARVADDRSRKRWLVSLVGKDPACGPMVADLARGMRAEYGAEVLLAVARQGGADRDALIREALAAVRTLDDDEEDKRGLLVSLSQELSGAERDACLRDAQGLAGRIEDPLDRASALSELVVDRPDVMSALLESLDHARTFVADDENGAGNPGDTIQTIVGNLPATQRARVAGPATRVAMEIRDPYERSLALTALLLAVDAEEGARLSVAALEAVRSIADTSTRAGQLLELAGALAEAQRGPIVAEAEALILGDPEPASRASGLLRLARLPGDPGAGHLASALAITATQVPAAEAVSLLTAAAADLPDALSEATLTAARNAAAAIPDRFGRARALVEIGLAASPARTADLMRDAMRIPGWFLALGFPEEDTLERIELLGQLLEALTAEDREGPLREATHLAATLDRPYDRARGLSALVPFLASVERQSAVDEIRRYAGEATRADERAELLTALSRFSSGEARSALRREAVEAIGEIGPGEASLTGSVNMLTGSVRIDNAPDIMGRPSLALLRLARESEAAERDLVLTRAVDRLFEAPASIQRADLPDLAPYLSVETVRALLAEFRDLRQDPQRRTFARALQASVRSRAQVNAGDVVAGAQAEEDADSTGDSEGDLLHFRVETGPLDEIFRLSRPPHQPFVKLTYEEPIPQVPVALARERDASILDQVALDMLANLSGADLERLHADAMALDGTAWHRPIARLLERLARTGSAQSALEEASLIWPDAIPPIVAATIAASAPSPLGHTLAEDARSRADALPPAERAIVLALTLPHARVERSDATRAGASENGLKSARAVEELTSLARQLSASEAQDVMKSLPETMRDLPAIVRLALVQAQLHGFPGRRELLDGLSTLLPVLTGLSGPGFVPAMAAAVARAGGWIR